MDGGGGLPRELGATKLGLASLDPQASMVDGRHTSLEDLMSFEGGEQLFRGTRLRHVIGGFAQIFKQSEGSALTYGLSEEVATQLDAFISHNWAVGRKRKFCALAFFFNFNIAARWTLLATIPVAVACALRLLPFDAEAMQAPEPSGYLAKLTLGPFFLVCFVCSRDFCWSKLPGYDPLVFVDKICIHQTDMDVQGAGIRKLGAFLARSKHMLVLYNDLYFFKLWTVYEVACFLSLKKAQYLVIVPLSQAINFIIMLVQVCLLTTAITVIPIYVRSDFEGYLVLLALILVTVHLVGQRKWTRDKQKLLYRIRHFDVRSCLCAVESDRPVVYRNIALLMRTVVQLSPDASLDEALDAFNTLVKSELLTAIRASLGRCAYGYKHYVAVGAMASGSLMIDALEGLTDGTDRGQLLAYELYVLAWVFLLWPTALVFNEYLAAMFLLMQGIREVAWVLIALVLSVALFVAFELASRAVMERAGTSAVWLLAEGCGIAVLVFAVICANRCCYRQKAATLAQEQVSQALGRAPSASGTLSQEARALRGAGAAAGSALGGGDAVGSPRSPRGGGPGMPPSGSEPREAQVDEPQFHAVLDRIVV